MLRSPLGAVIVCVVVLTVQSVSASDDTILSDSYPTKRSRHEKEQARRAIAPDAQPTTECDLVLAERFEEGPDESAVPSLEILEEMAGKRSVISGVVSASRIETTKPCRPPSCRSMSTRRRRFRNAFTSCTREAACSLTGCDSATNLARDGFHLTGVDDAVTFELDADGNPNEISWTSADSGDGTEVFFVEQPR